MKQVTGKRKEGKKNTREDNVSRYTGLQVTLYGRGEPIAMNHTSSSTGRGGTAYLGKDILGSVRSVTNESGQLEDRYEYDAFGKPYQGDLDNGMNLGYMGKPYDSNTGLYNYGYRDYKPEAARFTTVDPIRDGSNWFVYVNSDPVNYTDLWGLESKENRTVNIEVKQPDDVILAQYSPQLYTYEHYKSYVAVNDNGTHNQADDFIEPGSEFFKVSSATAPQYTAHLMMHIKQQRKKQKNIMKNIILHHQIIMTHILKLIIL